MAFETLPDDVLLEIFDLCLYEEEDEDTDPLYAWASEEDRRCSYDAWFALSHVCQRWRYVVFASPRRLNLRLHCSKRRVREMLGVWPALPVVIWNVASPTWDEDNFIATLEHRDRVCEIKLGRLTRIQLEILMPLMQESFPALKSLYIRSYSHAHDQRPVLPDSFLGGSAPQLRFLCLESIPFPAFQNLLLSASNLVYLYLSDPPFAYISSEMVATLSSLIKLEVMRLCFGNLDSDSDLKEPALPPLTRSVLPALKGLDLQGRSKYLDDFVARIDVPSINYLKIVPNDRHPFLFNFIQLPLFIGRAEKFRTLAYAGIRLSDYGIGVTLSPQRLTPGSCSATLQLTFLTDVGPILALAEACHTSLLPFSKYNIKNFDISAMHSDQDPQSGFHTDDLLWLEVLRQIPSAKKLSLRTMDVVPPVAFTLKNVIEKGITGVLPVIQDLSVLRPPSAGPVLEAIEQFVTARGLSGFGTPPFSRWCVCERDTHEG